MMPMQVRRKASKLEKVENLYCTATAWKTLPTRADKSDHACAIARTSMADPAPRGGQPLAGSRPLPDRIAALAGYESFRRRIL
jgi:hypothetical protein